MSKAKLLTMPRVLNEKVDMTGIGYSRKHEKIYTFNACHSLPSRHVPIEKDEGLTLGCIRNFVKVCSSGFQFQEGEKKIDK